MADEVTTVEEFLTYLSANVPPDGDHWFRGHASDGWDLSASVFRTQGRRDNEAVMLKRFIQEARRHLPNVPVQWWDWVFLAQHHQVPTRLLDWSESPLVGLYFAALDHFDIDGDPKSTRDGRVWIIQPTAMNNKMGFKFQKRDIPLFGLDQELDRYSPFDGDEHDLPPIAGLAARSFNRISTQWGTFTVCNTPSPLDLLPDHQEFLASVVVPQHAKPTIRQQLARLGIEDRTIYMDLFRLGQKLGVAYG